MTDNGPNIEDYFEKIRTTNDSFDYSIDIDDKGIKRYKGLTSIILDLAFVKESIEFLIDSKENKTKTIERSLFISSIITYGRSFTQTRGRGTKLDPDDYIKPEYMELHKYLMELRHEYIAHAGISDSEKIYATANFSVDKDASEVIMRIGYEMFGQVGLSIEQQQLFLKLIDDLTNTLKSKSKEAVIAYMSSLTTKDKNELLGKAWSKKNAR